jgi:hypothetical protein
MAGHLVKGLRTAALLSVTIVALLGGCNRPRSTPEDAGAAVNEISHALIGKQITIRGKFSLRGKFDPYVLLDNGQVVYIESRGSFTWGEPYSAMEGKLVTATGILRFYHDPDAPTSRPSIVARAPDHYYLESETPQLRLISH